MVFVVAGFILPRFIDGHIGQAGLGVWDFAWSFVSYFGLAGIGVGSSVNRYVAKYRAVHDTEALRTAVSSVWFIQMISSLIVAFVSIGAGLSVPYVFANRLGDQSVSAQTLVILLGFNLSVQMAFDSYRGVITGCHRWDIHNGLNAGTYALTTIGMVVALACGGHLVSLGAVYLCCASLGELVRVYLAHRICPEIQIRLKYVTWNQSRTMIEFGLKRMAGGITGLIVIQGTSLFVAGYLGPAALAVFSRPIALVRHLDTFINKFASVLTPTVGSLKSAGRHRELQDLFLKSTQFGVFLALPMILFLALLGDPILRVWMGERYEYGMILAVLAVGSFLPLTQQSAMAILVGMNLHGKATFACVLGALCAFGIAVAALTVTGWQLLGAALVIAFSSTVTGGILAFYSCYLLRVSVLDFFRQVYLLPVACNLPFAICLLGIRSHFANEHLIALIIGCCAAVLTLGPLYWRYVVPRANRQKIKIYLGLSHPT